MRRPPPGTADWPVVPPDREHNAPHWAQPFLRLELGKLAPAWFRVSSPHLRYRFAKLAGWLPHGEVASMAPLVHVEDKAVDRLAELGLTVGVVGGGGRRGAGG